MQPPYKSVGSDKVNHGQVEELAIDTTTRSKPHAYSTRPKKTDAAAHDKVNNKNPNGGESCSRESSQVLPQALRALVSFTLHQLNHHDDLFRRSTPPPLPHSGIGSAPT